MKTHTFSIVVGDARCNANCPFCVSKMTGNPPAINTQINWQRFETACNIAGAASDGLISVLLTGKGEPLLFPEQIHEYLSRLNCKAATFPLVDMQTNGIEIMHPTNPSPLPLWARMGLTLVSLSVADWHPGTSAGLMGIPHLLNYDYWKAVERIHDAGLSCRINCTMVDNGVDSIYQVKRLIKRCKERGVEQLTIRPVTRPATYDGSSKVVEWVNNNQPALTARQLYDFLALEGTELLRLPHGASVFDYHGQNVCVGNCLTDTTDPNDIRQIIFFPDGRIAYDWKYKGARIL